MVHDQVMIKNDMFQRKILHLHIKNHEKDMINHKKSQQHIIFHDCDWAGNVHCQKQASKSKVEIWTQFF